VRAPRYQRKSSCSRSSAARVARFEIEADEPLQINLDGEPPSSLCEKIKGDNADVLDLHLVKL